MEVLFLRHGHPEFDGRTYPDHFAMPLSERGRLEAVHCVEAVERFAPNAVLSSDFRRAQETAVIAASGVDVSVQLRAELRARVFYSLAGKSFGTILSEHGPSAKLLLDGNSDNFDLPGEETYAHAKQRVFAFAANLRENFGGLRLLVVSHGGPHAWLVGASLGVDLRGVRSFNLRTAHFSRFMVTERGVALDAMNLPPEGVLH